MRWNENDEKDNRIVKATEWFPILGYDMFLEARAGVYVFADDEKDVKYIGKAGAGRMIVEGKTVAIMVFEVLSAINREKDHGALLVKALYTNSDSSALSLEGELIKKYDPPNNGVNLL